MPSGVYPRPNSGGTCSARVETRELEMLQILEFAAAAMEQNQGDEVAQRNVVLASRMLGAYRNDDTKTWTKLRGEVRQVLGM